MIWEFAREDWEAAAPRPWLLVVRGIVRGALALVCALVTVAWLYVIL